MLKIIGRFSLSIILLLYLNLFMIIKDFIHLILKEILLLLMILRIII